MKKAILVISVLFTAFFCACGTKDAVIIGGADGPTVIVIGGQTDASVMKTP